MRILSLKLLHGGDNQYHTYFIGLNLLCKQMACMNLRKCELNTLQVSFHFHIALFGQC